MPGIEWYSSPPGFNNAPEIEWLPAPNNALGLTPPTAPINKGDILCKSTASALNTPQTTLPIIRQLLPADKTALYLAGGANAGIYGVAQDGILTTDAAGKYLAQNQNGAIFPAPNMASVVGNDKLTGRAKVPVLLFRPRELFTGRLDLNLTDFPVGTYPTGFTVTNQFDGLLAGIIIRTDATGTTYFSIQPQAGTNGSIVGAATNQAIVRIRSAVQSDIWYNKLQVPAANVLGCRLIFEVLTTYTQSTSVNVVYTAQ